MREHCDITIGQRAYAEAIRCYGGPGEFERRTSQHRKVIYNWRDGGAPSALWLARLHYAGADVLYILTGRRST